MTGPGVDPRQHGLDLTQPERVVDDAGQLGAPGEDGRGVEEGIQRGVHFDNVPHSLGASPGLPRTRRTVRSIFENG